MAFATGTAMAELTMNVTRSDAVVARSSARRLIRRYTRSTTISFQCLGLLYVRRDCVCVCRQVRPISLVTLFTY